LTFSDASTAIVGERGKRGKRGKRGEDDARETDDLVA